MTLSQHMDTTIKSVTCACGLTLWLRSWIGYRNQVLNLLLHLFNQKNCVPLTPCPGILGICVKLILQHIKRLNYMLYFQG